MTTDLTTAVRDLLDRAIERNGSPSITAKLEAERVRLDEPLRVAIAGKVKSGKSTLLNALVGEELAPTDAGECTTVVTWYREGLRRRVVLVTDDGAEIDAQFSRRSGALEIDLDGHGGEDLDRIDIEWPSSALNTVTLIDTPGIASLTEGVSTRTADFLTPGQSESTPADAVIYLMRHLHTSDLEFLEAFHDDRMATATPVNAVALIARADEIGVGRLDSMDSAERIAARYRDDVKLRGLVQTVLPVAALIGQAGATLTEQEYAAFAKLAGSPDSESLLLSADRFGGVGELEDPHGPTRRKLLERFGMFGCRVAVAAIRSGEATNAAALSRALLARSGLAELRSYLYHHFTERRDVLKAWSALLGMQPLADRAAADGDPWLAGEIERLTAGAHELTELRLLNALRLRGLPPSEDSTEIERLLGAEGLDPSSRLGLEPGTGKAELRKAAAADLQRWQRKVENPLTDQDTAYTARVLIRTCEAMLVGL